MNSQRTVRIPCLGIWCHVGPDDTAMAKTDMHYGKYCICIIYMTTAKQLYLVGPKTFGAMNFLATINPSVKQGRVNLILSIDMILSWYFMVRYFFLISGYSCNITWITFWIFIFSHEIIIWLLCSYFCNTCTSEIFISRKNVWYTQRACGSPRSTLGLVNVEPMPAVFSLVQLCWLSYQAE